MQEYDPDPQVTTDYESALIYDYLGTEPRGWRTYAPQKPAIHKAWLPTIHADTVEAVSITQTSAWVVWATNVAATSEVHWDTVSHPSGGTAAYAYHTGQEDVFPSVAVHVLQLLGLSPDTTYYYRVESSGAVSGEESFATQP